MSELLDWNEVAPDRVSTGSSTVSNKGKFLRLEPNKPYRIRLLNKAKPVWRYYRTDEKNRSRFAVTADPNKCPVKAKYPELKASERYAILVIDRADGELKVYEGPASVFRVFREYADHSGTNPGDIKNGADFTITAELKDGQPKKNTKYHVKFKERNSLTKEEVEIIRKNQEEFKLTQLLAPNSPEEIEKRLFGEWEEAKSKGGSEDSSTDSVGESTTDDDAFNWG